MESGVRQRQRGEQARKVLDRCRTGAPSADQSEHSCDGLSLVEHQDSCTSDFCRLQHVLLAPLLLNRITAFGVLIDKQRSSKNSMQNGLPLPSEIDYPHWSAARYDARAGLRKHVGRTIDIRRAVIRRSSERPSPHLQ